jgi:hypothetical protein
MTDQTVNIPLLRKAVEWAEAEAAKPPELCEWRQTYWVTPASEVEAAMWGIWADSRSAVEVGRAPECGTCYCVAGYVVASQVGAEPGGCSRARPRAPRPHGGPEGPAVQRQQQDRRRPPHRRGHRG